MNKEEILNSEFDENNELENAMDEVIKNQLDNDNK